MIPSFLNPAISSCLPTYPHLPFPLVPFHLASAQLAGQWYARACGLEPIVKVDQAYSALQTVFDFNVIRFGNARRGCVNGRIASRVLSRMRPGPTCPRLRMPPVCARPTDLMPLLQQPSLTTSSPVSPV